MRKSKMPVAIRAWAALFGFRTDTKALPDDLMRTEKDIHLVLVQPDAGPAQGGHDAAPVGVGAGHGGFYQRRQGHGPGGFHGLAGVAAPSIITLKTWAAPSPSRTTWAARSAMTVCNKEPKISPAGDLQFGDGRMSGRAAGQEQDTVIGAGVAVHGNAIKTAGQAFFQSRFQGLGAPPPHR